MNDKTEFQVGSHVDCVTCSTWLQSSPPEKVNTAGLQHSFLTSADWVEDHPRDCYIINGIKKPLFTLYIYSMWKFNIYTLDRMKDS